MNLNQLTNATQAKSSSGTKLLSFITDACDKYDINTPVRQLCFLSQIGHESMGLFFTEELASGSSYEGRKDLGNNQSGDGKRFKGRGLIQITGRENYKKLSKELGVDLEKNPELLGGKNINTSSQEQLKYAALSAGWF